MTHDPLTRALTPPREAEARKKNKTHVWTLRARHLRKQDDSLQWAWGALADYGYTTLGMSYDEMAAIARKRRQTLYNRAAVHRAWPDAERVYDKLTWSHYEAAHALPEEWRRKLMDAAQEHGATVEQLREAVRDLRRKLDGKEDEPLPQSFTGTGTARIEGEYRLIVDIDPQTLNMPDWAFDGADVEITIQRRK